MNGFDLSTASNIYIGGAQASAVYIGSTKIWPGDEYRIKYLTIRAQGNCYVTCNNREGADQAYYSLDDGDTWTAFPAYSSSWKNNTSLSLSTGDEVMLKCTQTNTDRGLKQLKVHVTDRYRLEGNIMSMLDGDNFKSSASTRLSYAFYYMFSGETNLSSIYNLRLPANTLTEFCYCEMFSGCTAITLPVNLPATNLATRCYNSMFEGCTSLGNTPDLNATTLTDYCYGAMFRDCTSINQAVLPATTLAVGSYYYMFDGCSNFNKLYFRALDISASYCVDQMLKDTNQYASGYIYIPQAATYDTSTFVPSGWTVMRQ